MIRVDSIPELIYTAQSNSAQAGAKLGIFATRVPVSNGLHRRIRDVLVALEGDQG